MLLDGARLDSNRSFRQGSSLTIGRGSLLRVADFSQYSELGAGGEATWLSGTLEARDILLSRGSLGAGAEGEAAEGTLRTEHLGFAGAHLLLDIDSAELYDRLFITGRVDLDGELRVDFGDAGPTLGTFRFLTAEGGVAGSFDRLVSSLDPSAYRLTAFYGADHVELTVAAVPEPQTYALVALGRAGMAAWTRRRRARG